MIIWDYIKTAALIIKEAGEGWSQDRAAHLSAALAFYAIFAIAPLILIVIATTGLIFGQEAAQAEIIAQVEQFVGVEAREMIVRLIDNWRDPRSGLIATVVGTVTTLYLGFRVFDALRDTLDMVWGVRLRPDISWGNLGKVYLKSFGVMLLVGPMFVLTVLLSGAFSALASALGGWFPLPANFGELANFGISVGVGTVMFGVMYKVLPDVHIHWRDVGFGAVITAILFWIGKFLISWYMVRTSTTSVFGAAGSLVVLLFWVYYSAQILFFGAELTEARARHSGREIEPDPFAVPVVIPGGRRRRDPHPDDVTPENGLPAATVEPEDDQ
jgi:membrane protein